MAVSCATGNVRGQRITEVRAFEAGYFHLLQQGEYNRAYDLLHPEIKTVIPLERYRTFFAVLTDALGPMQAWQPPSTRRDRIALFDPRRHMDPLPPDKPKAALQANYRVVFEKGQVTLIVRTGWDKDRMVIRQQNICCADKPTVAALQARAVALGVGSLFGVRTAPPAAPAHKPATAPAVEPPGAPTNEPATAPTGESGMTPTNESDTTPTSEMGMTPAGEQDNTPSNEPTKAPINEPAAATTDAPANGPDPQKP